MKEFDRKTALRLPSEYRTKMDQLVAEGKYKNLSVLVRTALQEFLKERG